MEKAKWLIFPNGHVGRSGTDFNNRDPITLLVLNKEIAIFKVPGGAHWTSLGAPFKSHGGEIIVLQIESVENVLAPTLEEMRTGVPGRYYATALIGEETASFGLRPIGMTIQEIEKALERRKVADA